jgi:hypothetical protein
MTDDDLSTAMHDRMIDEHPDLDRLISASTQAGTRLRRRRTATAGLGCVVAGVAVVAIVGSALGGGGDPAGTDPGVATQPTATASPTATPPDVVPPQPPAGQDLPMTVVLGALRDWEVGAAADDKFPASKGDDFLTVQARPMSEYAAWSGNDPDHPSSQVVHVGENYFVTVQPARSVPLDVVAELVHALRYDVRWKR